MEQSLLDLMREFIKALNRAEGFSFFLTDDESAKLIELRERSKNKLRELGYDQ